MLKELIKSLIRTIAPRLGRLYFQTILRKWRRSSPAGKMVFGSFRNLTPMSKVFGIDRGTPIDRYYIQQFLSECSADIKGHVLEIGSDHYTRKYGGDNVSNVDVLHVDESAKGATIIADLSEGENIPSETFDCVIVTQTFQFIYQVHSAVGTVHRILKEGGVLLATVPGISQISRYDMDKWGDYWRFTNLSARRLLEECFEESTVDVNSYGNVLVSIAMLHGLAAQELTKDELQYRDPDYDLLLAIRAVKRSS